MLNPLTAWAIYGSIGVQSSCWNSFDNLTVLQWSYKVKVSAYSTIFYPYRLDRLRAGRRGAWETIDVIKMLIHGTKERGMKLAFRIIVDSRDKLRNCP